MVLHKLSFTINHRVNCYLRESDAILRHSIIDYVFYYEIILSRFIKYEDNVCVIYIYRYRYNVYVCVGISWTYYLDKSLRNLEEKKN